VDLSKYFTITDGFQDFLPYYKLTDYSTWLTPPAETMVWETELNWDLDGSAAANEIAAVAASFYGAKVDYVWGYNSLYVDLLTDDYDYITVQVNLDGCQYTLDDDATIHTLSTTSCVDTAGYAEYQNFNVTIPDVLIFTDKQGNETIHAYKLALPKNEAGDSWTISDMKDLIIFPDPTFHGIFPDMTQDSIWNLIETLYSFGKSMDNEDEDAEWTDDEMDFDEYSRSL
jgi:hypothetical protein